MNILHLSSHMNTGGITSYITTLAAELIRRGHGVVVVAADGDARLRLEAMGVRCLVANIRVKSELHPLLYLNVPKLCRIIKEHKIDVIHAHSRTTQVLGTVISALTGCPVVTTCHGFFKPRLHRRLFGCWGRHVIAISQSVRKHLVEDFHLHHEKIVYIANGIDLVQFPIVDNQRRLKAREMWNIKAKVVIGLIARLSSVKGIDVLIDAFALIARENPDVLLLIVGDGPEAEALQSQVRRLNLQDRVHFEKALASTASILPVFDVIVTPSRMEGLGLSAMEAMACALPVVASRVGGLVDLIEDGQNGWLVNPGDSQQLALVIKIVLSDASRAALIGQNARMRIAQSFTSVAMAEQTLSVYEKAIKSVFRMKEQ